MNRKLSLTEEQVTNNITTKPSITINRTNSHTVNCAAFCIKSNEDTNKTLYNIIKRKHAIHKMACHDATSAREILIIHL